MRLSGLLLLTHIAALVTLPDRRSGEFIDPELQRPQMSTTVRFESKPVAPVAKPADDGIPAFLKRGGERLGEL